MDDEENEFKIVEENPVQLFTKRCTRSTTAKIETTEFMMESIILKKKSPKRENVTKNLKETVNDDEWQENFLSGSPLREFDNQLGSETDTHC